MAVRRKLRVLTLALRFGSRLAIHRGDVYLDDGVLTRPMKRYAARLAELALPNRRCQLPT
jgi:hypothetical protein